MKIKPVGDQAVLVEMGEQIEETVNRRVVCLQRKISQAGGVKEGILEMVPAFTSLLVYYDSLRTDAYSVEKWIRALEEAVEEEPEQEGRIVEIPVCYGGSYGEDLSYVAAHAGLTEEEVIRIHSGRDYRIYMLGFLPGFPYLGGMDERIMTPRLSVPRTRIPAGSVGIGGEQTGIYPLDSPGGWQLIGRTPLCLFNLRIEGETLYQVGDRIRFCPIGTEEYKRLLRNQRKRF